jgi:RsiW-degrading membrane proteinase PrsW (M82 family)
MSDLEKAAASWMFARFYLWILAIGIGWAGYQYFQDPYPIDWGQTIWCAILLLLLGLMTSGARR